MEILIKTLWFIAIILLVIGLYKPWVVLWWMARQTRMKVIKVYGLLVLLLGLTILLIS